MPESPYTPTQAIYFKKKARILIRSFFVSIAAKVNYAPVMHYTQKRDD